MRILLVSDAWEPHVNGVVTTVRYLIGQLELAGHMVKLIHPGQFPSVALFCHPDLQMVTRPWQLIPVLQKFQPDAIHIFSEGPLGVFLRIYCEFKKIPFTTSYHTRFPELAQIYLGIPVAFVYPVLNWFHSKASRTVVSTETMLRLLTAKLPGCAQKLTVWDVAVDHKLFCPEARNFESTRDLVAGLKRPILLCVSRLDKEKGIENFCRLPDSKFTKILVGDGTERKRLEAEFGKSMIFTGYKTGPELASFYASADCFIFTSLVECFPNVILEAMACGTPTVAHKVPGPVDILVEGVSGYMVQEGDDFQQKIYDAIQLDRNLVQESSLKWNLENNANQFITILKPITDLSVYYGRRYGYKLIWQKLMIWALSAFFALFILLV